MPNNPKNTEEKLLRILNAWKKLAADKTFGGMTLPEFEALIAPSFAARQALKDLDNQIIQVQTQREDADDFSLNKAELVVDGVIGDPAFGRDSALIEAMGYTRKSERKSGLTRKTGSSSPGPKGQGS